MNKGTGNLTELAMHFTNEDSARELLEKMRCPNGACCPKCGGADPYRLTVAASGKNKGSPPGAVEVQPVPEVVHGHGRDDLRALQGEAVQVAGRDSPDGASKKGRSAHRVLGVKSQTAWFMAHRLRAAMAQDSVPSMFDTVEVDEAYVGGKESEQGHDGWYPARREGARAALVERHGRVRAFPMPLVTHDKLQTAIRERVKLSAHIVTDGHRGYNALSMGFASHNTVNHTAHEYVRGTSHTNAIESSFGILKRGINGVYHHVGKGHLHRYCDEFASATTTGPRSA